MKILIAGDIHFSQYSSILRRRGTYFSKRLENCINSVNWVEQTAEEERCDRIIYLGDFFDRADLNAEEISALKEIQWSDIPKQLIVGNHELGSSNGEYNTAQVLDLLPNFEIISSPKAERVEDNYLLFLPYIFEGDRKAFNEYLTQNVSSSHLYVFSHNDIKGINYGAFISKEGFDLDELVNCDYFFNGHIHNGQKLTSKVINVGNLTGQNFNEDAFKYTHNIYVLDTGSNVIESHTNPYAYNFYKIEINDTLDISKLSFLAHAVVSAKCKESLVPLLKEFLEKNSHVDDFRIVTVVEMKSPEEEEIPQFISKDHLAQFRDYIVEKLGTSEYVLKELQEVLNVN